jgi:hypothetical protein
VISRSGRSRSRGSRAYRTIPGFRPFRAENTPPDGFPDVPRASSSGRHESQAGMNRRIAASALSPALAHGRGCPAHGGVKPDRRPAAALERFAAAQPVPALAARGCQSAHAPASHHAGCTRPIPSSHLCDRARGFHRTRRRTSETEGAPDLPDGLVVAR